MKMFFMILSIVMAVSNASNIISPKIIGPILIEEASTLDVFNAGKVTIYGTIKLGVCQSDNIFFKANGIQYPGGDVPAYLGIDKNGKIITVSAPAVYISDLVAAAQPNQHISLGILGYNYLNFIADSGDISLNTDVLDANIRFRAHGDIFFESSSIMIPTDNYYYLCIDNNGRLVSIVGDSSADGIFNNLKAAASSNQSIALGMNGQNALEFSSDSGDVVLSGLEAVVVSAPQVILDGGDVRLGNQNLWPSDCSVSNYLMIDCQGNITTSCSSARFKKDIQYLESLPDNSFSWIDALMPCQFRYQNSYDQENNNSISVGYLAEDLHNCENLKNFVIYNRTGEPTAIDYNSVLVLVIYVLKRRLLECENLIKSLLENIRKDHFSFQEIESRLLLLEAQYKILLEK